MKGTILIWSLLALAACATMAPPPSPAAGTWRFSLDSQMGAIDAKVTMVVEDSTLTGEFDMGGGRTWPIENGTVDGQEIAFDLNRDGASMTYVMAGRVEEDSIKGTAAAMGSTIEWTMTRGE